jgi:hypothetical protein
MDTQEKMRIMVVGNDSSAIAALSLLDRMASISVAGIEEEREVEEFKIKMTPKFEFDTYIPKRVDKRVSDNHFLKEIKKMRRKGKR